MQYTTSDNLKPTALAKQMSKHSNRVKVAATNIGSLIETVTVADMGDLRNISVPKAHNGRSMYAPN